jgi:zinc protease
VLISTAKRTAPAGAPRALPALGAERPFQMPETVDVVLANGLRILAVRAASAPLVEVRMRLPLPEFTPELSAAAQILSMLVLRRTAHRTPETIDDTFGRAGAGLHSANDESWLGIYGSTTTTGLPAVLDVLFDALAHPAYDDAEFVTARQRLVEKSEVARAQPQAFARQALGAHRHGDLPLLRLTPDEETVTSVTADQVRDLHRVAVQPRGALLVLVGDIDPQRLVQELERGVSSWHSAAVPSRTVYKLPLVGTGVKLVDRPGAVQSQIVLAAQAPSRLDPRFPALSVANLVLGGYFSSRLVTHLREEKGLAYRVDSGFDDLFGNVSAVVDASTATEVTAVALREIRAELTHLVESGPTAAEIESARRYLLGMTALGLGSQSALATTLSNTIGFGYEPEWLRGYPEALREVTHAEVRAVTRDLYLPSRFAGVVVGDVGRIAGSLDPADLAW